MTSTSLDLVPPPLAASRERSERMRFPLVCPIRLRCAGQWIGEFRTTAINCEGFSCIVPNDLLTEAVGSGDTLEYEIDLAGALRLLGRATVLHTAGVGQGRSELRCGLVEYGIA